MQSRKPTIPSALAALLAAPAVALAAEPGDGGRLRARSRTTWVFAEPDAQSRRLGYLRAGAAVGSKAEEVVSGRGCKGGFHAIEPHGFVCADAVTRDPDERAVRVAVLLAPADGALPFRYALSNGAPMYRRLPLEAEWQEQERWLGEPGTFKRYRWHRKRERLAEVRVIAPDSAVPFFLEPDAAPQGRLVDRRIPLGSMLAYTRSFEHAGRTWLLSADGTVVPSDRVRPYRASTFSGVHLDGSIRLPVAWTRSEPAAKHRRGEDGFVPAGEPWPERTPIALEADAGLEGAYLATREADASGSSLYVRRADVVVVKPREPPARVVGAGKWIVVSVSDGTLVAYEGRRPVLTTLISPGAGGISRPGRDPVQASTTPRGSYRIQYKYRTQTMSPDKDKPEREWSSWIAEVPHAQYFSVPFAFHTAYWHEDFGEWMSGGCVNLSPADGAWLFEWTEPRLPEGWHAVWAGGPNGQGTVAIIER